MLAGAPELAGHTIARELARGGQGALYLAHDKRSRTPVAIKLLLDHRDGDASLRFLREADLLTRLMHPHLPCVLASGRCEAGAFMVMEFVNGVDLKRLVDAEGIPAFAWSARTVAVAASALDYAHKWGVVHRDVKPQNRRPEPRRFEGC